MSTEPSIHPFPGLRPFEENEQDLFFGREGQSEEILGRLRAQRFVAVVGASGSGKSSLVRAGLLPYLHGGFLAQAGSRWRIAIFRPGGEPIKNLAVALDQPNALGRTAEGADAAAQSAMLLEVSLRRSGLGLIEAVRLARLPEGEQVLVVVDQFEELFRFAGAADRPGGEEDAAAFVKLLLEASAQRELPIYVVLTMRSDYIGDCARYRDLPEAVTAGLYLIPRMTRDQRRAAIVEPVRVGGGSIAPRLVTRLLNDVGDDPDQLPILQHALMRTWDYWQARAGGARPIDVEDYLAIGGMTDALSQHADEAYDALPDDRHRAIAKRMFQALSEKGPDNREARRPTNVGKLAQVVDGPIDSIVRVAEDFRAPGRSFLTPAPNVALAPDSVIDISHESLIRGWRRMRQWVEDEAESARVYRRLADTASLHVQGIAGLMRDPDLENMLTWRDRERPNAAWGERYYPGFERAMAFLEQSRLARDAERRQRYIARRRVQIAGFAVTALIAVVAVVAVWGWIDARGERRNAQQALNVALQLVDTEVFDTMQQFRHQGLVQEVKKIADRAIEVCNQLIALSPVAEVYNVRGAAYYTENDYDHAIADYSQAIKLDPKDAPAYRNRGLAYYQKKEYDHAIADYDKAIAIAPKFAAAYDSRGNAHRAKGELDPAIADYTQAIKYVANNSGYHIDRGNAYYAENDYAHAAADYKEAIKLDPKDAAGYRNLGLAQSKENDYDDAIINYTKAIELDPKFAVAYDNRGDAYHAKGNAGHAVADYGQAIALEPKHASYYVDRGIAYTDEKKYGLAIADFTKAIALNAKYAWAYTDRGIVYYRKQDYGNAIADYDKAIAIDPKFAAAYDNRGDAYRAKGDLDHAIADYTEAITLDPKNASFYIDRGNAYVEKTDYDLAIADYNTAIKLDAKLAMAYNDRGYTYYLQKDYGKAMPDLDKAIALDPKFALAYDNRGDLYFAEGDFDHAIADLDEAIALDPDNAGYYDGRGNVYYAKPDYDRAIADYTKAIALDPENARYYVDRGNAYYGKNDYDHAIADYTKAVGLDPKYAWAYNDRGLAYYRKKDYGNAIADLDKAIALDPKFAVAYDNRGDAYRDKGDLGHAIADYTEAISLDPNNASYYIARGNAYFAETDYDYAIADYSQAIKLSPNDADLYVDRGNAYLDEGDFDRAIADYNEAIKLDPKYAAAYNDRGEAHEHKGDLDRALADYNEAIKLDPKFAMAYFGRGTADLYAGSLDDSWSDFEQARKLDPKYPYSAIWLEIVDKRGDRPSELVQAATQIDMSVWPAPVIRLYLGQSTPAQVLAAADNPDGNTRKGQVCEANFYIGELKLQQGDKAEAARLFHLAAADCPKSYIESAAATAELKALGQTLK
jgi:tetratricopeptide (TPR) repeat protein